MFGSPRLNQSKHWYVRASIVQKKIQLTASFAYYIVSNRVVVYSPVADHPNVMSIYIVSLLQRFIYSI